MGSPPTLPFEILAAIVHFAAPPPPFVFTQLDWAKGVQHKTLKSLCLVSTAFNKIATPLLYSHVVVRSATKAEFLIRTLRSERWQTGQRQGKSNELVKAITIERCMNWGPPVASWIADEALSLLGEANLERVALVGFKVNIRVLDRMQTVRYLHLSNCELVTANHVRLPSLSRLTHLQLTDLTLNDVQALGMGTPIQNPAFSHLSVRSTPFFSFVPFELQLRDARQLKFLAMHDPSGAKIMQLAIFVPEMMVLDQVYVTSTKTHVAKALVQHALPRLRCSLGTLDATGLLLGADSLTDMRTQLEARTPWNAELKLLRLLTVSELLRQHLEEFGYVSAPELGRELERVVRVAEARGIRVEQR